VTVLRNYRLISLALLVLAVVGGFLGFFFLWVLAPVALICLCYLLVVAGENREGLTAAIFRDRLRLRHDRLAEEAAARREQLRRRE
jgi:hypothetical protein